MTGTYVPPIFRASSNFSNLRGYVRFLVGGGNFSNFFVQKNLQIMPIFAGLGADLLLYYNNIILTLEKKNFK